ncbi:MAG: transpeptidase family protein [Deltaproteobacteria bacterium]|nr:transpeptidase family protein [Deltaproteobacteria bacterium]
MITPGSVGQAERRREQWIRARMAVVLALLFIGLIGIGGRAMQLHLGEQQSLKWVAAKQYRAVIPTAPRRGKILDAKGRELAIDVPVQSIYADPRQIRDHEAVLSALQTVLPLGGEAATIRRRLAQGGKFVWIRRRVEQDVADRVRALKRPGIHTVEETRRFYPNGALASQLLGAVGLDAEPLAGIELAYQDELGSQRGQLVYQRDARGRVFYTQSAGERPPLANVELTLDKVIQHQTEISLATAVASAQARGGVAIVGEVATGRVLAMASMPSYDPNDYARYEQSRWRNRAITDTYEPGSTFKVFIAAVALEDGMDPERRFDCERGQLRIGHAVVHDHDPYGILSLREIVKVSSNIGALKVAQAVGRDRFGAILQAFRIGVPTGIDFPGEVAGILRDPRGWQPVEMATIAFGQGITATPLQMTMAFAAIANGGRLMRPYLVERIRRDDGVVMHEAAPTLVGAPIRPETAQRLTELLIQVVEPGGTGTKAASAAYAVAGKTGTAQKVVEGTGRYAAGKYYASFIGFAPAQLPRIAVYVGIDEPRGPYFGGVVAAPVFKEIVEATLTYLGEPTRNASVIVMKRPQETERVRQISDRAISAEQKVAASEPASDSAARPDEGRFLVPDFHGMPVREVMRRTGEAGVAVRLEGTGLVVEQQPAAGTLLVPGRTLAVRCAFPE